MPRTTVPEGSADPGRLRQAAIALLARRDYASTALQSALEARGHDRDGVAALIATLRSERLVDDDRYAANYVAYHAERGQGPVRISSALRAVGLPETTIGPALASVTDWRARAARQRARKFGRSLPTSWAERARQARFLQYRGFSSDDIRSVLGTDIDPET